MCNLLLEQYNSVFSLPCAEKTIKNPEDYFVSDKINSCENETLSDILLNTDVISEAINEMSTNSAAGPDGMPASLFTGMRFFRNFHDLRGHSRGNPRSDLIFMGGGGGGSLVVFNILTINLFQILFRHKFHM